MRVNDTTINEKFHSRCTEVSVERTFPEKEIQAGPAFLFLIFLTIIGCFIFLLAREKRLYIIFALRANYLYIFLDPYPWSLTHAGRGSSSTPVRTKLHGGDHG